MKRYFNDLKKILAFALIKVAPGLFNVALIPFLVARLRPDAYGNYSLWLSYAMLVATVIGAVVTQPMYRYLSSRPEDRALFDSFMLVAAVAAGAISTAVAVGLNAPGWLPLGYAAFSAGTVLSAGVSVGFQIDRRIGRLALYEGLRVLTIVLPIAATEPYATQLALATFDADRLAETTTAVQILATAIHQREAAAAAARRSTEARNAAFAELRTHIHQLRVAVYAMLRLNPHLFTPSGF